MDPAVGLVDRLTGPVGPVAGLVLVLVAAVVVVTGGWLHRRLRAGRPEGGREPRREASGAAPAGRVLPRGIRPARFSPLRQPPRPPGPAGRRRAPGGREASGRSDARDGD